MRRLRVTVIDVVSMGGKRHGIGKLMSANLASLMPQVVATWAEELGHVVRFVCYTTAGDLDRQLLQETDVLFVSAFTRAAQTAYAIGNLARRHGAVTVLGGPHARCYPQDAARYFDYVIGLTDKATIATVLAEAAPHRPLGRLLTAARQPTTLPGVAQRWKFIEPTIAKARLFKVVPMLGSLGCPYTCSFCIDSTVDYQTLPFDAIVEDLRFLLTKLRRPRVAWLDPNFGVRFDDYMATIERAARPGQIRFIAESSLSLLSEPHLQRLRRNGFDGLLPGIESWYEVGNKSKTGRNLGLDKVRQVAEHINLILRYVPYVQANLILGLDSDEGPEPFETAGGIFNALPYLGPDPFMVVNGDIWTDYAFSRRALPDDATAHLVLVPNPAHHARGDFSLQDGRVIHGSGKTYTFSGIAQYRPEFFAGCSPGRSPLLPLLKRAIDAHSLSGELYQGTWSDVGTPERLALLQSGKIT